jgi:hypothetical protein
VHPVLPWAHTLLRGPYDAGSVLILGPIGLNLGAGMTGHRVVWDPITAVKAHHAATAPTTRRPETADRCDLGPWPTRSKAVKL